MYASPSRSRIAVGLQWSVLDVVAMVLGVVVAVVFMKRRAPTDSYGPPRDPAPSPRAASTVTDPSAGLLPSAESGVGPSIVSGLSGGLAAGAGIVAGEEVAHHLLNSGEHEVNVPTETAGQQHQSDPPDDRDFSVSGDGSWDVDNNASGDARL